MPISYQLAQQAASLPEAGSLNDVHQAIEEGTTKTFLTTARVSDISRCNNSYVVSTRMNVDLFIVTLALCNTEGTTLEVKGIGNFVGRLFGVSASRFRQHEISNNSTALAAIFSSIDTESTHNFVIKVALDSYTQEYKATATKIVE